MSIKTRWAKFITLLLMATVALDSFGAEWPARRFAPYRHLGADDNFKITDCADACGQKYYPFTLDDARAPKVRADQQPWICSLSFWASNREAGKTGGNGNDDTTSGIPPKPWDFNTMFQPFTNTNK